MVEKSDQLLPFRNEWLREHQGDDVLRVRSEVKAYQEALGDSLRLVPELKKYESRFGRLQCGAWGKGLGREEAFCFYFLKVLGGVQDVVLIHRMDRQQQCVSVGVAIKYACGSDKYYDKGELSARALAGIFSDDDLSRRFHDMSLGYNIVFDSERCIDLGQLRRRYSPSGYHPLSILRTVNLGGRNEWGAGENGVQRVFEGLRASIPLMTMILDEIVSRLDSPTGPFKYPQELETRSIPMYRRDSGSTTFPGVAQNIILYGPPGTGKTYCTIRRALQLVWSKEEEKSVSDLPPERRRVRELELFRHYQSRGRIEFVTFHQSYGYEDFVEGIRPILSHGGSASIDYELHQGVFKRIAMSAADAGVADLGVQAEYAMDRPCEHIFRFSTESPQYVLIVDEINRGNISKILGELITLLEPDKRLTCENELRLRLPSSPEHLFAVPPNLHIIGTMNTADRSIALMDVALRRRFTFEELMPDQKVIREVLEARGNAARPVVRLVEEVFGILNKRIRIVYDRDHQLGHSFFLGISDLKSLREAFLKHFIPLLQEYFYGDWVKICIVLGCPRTEGGEAAGTGLDVAADGKYAFPIIVAEALDDVEVLGLDNGDYSDRLAYSINPGLANDTWTEEELARAFLAVLNLNASDFEGRLDELLNLRPKPEVATTVRAEPESQGEYPETAESLTQPAEPEKPQGESK